MTTPRPRLSLVVSTVGRVDELERLLDSLQTADQRCVVELVVIDQSADQRCAELVRRRPPAGPWQVGRSGPGVSRGRNVGLTMARADVIAIPNDNCWYASDTVTSVLAYLDEHPEVSGVSGRLVTDLGRPSLLRWQRRPRQVTRRNFWRTTISSTIFLRRTAINDVGWFDESIGAGSPGAVGAGEESDLVLRVLDAGYRVDYLPRISVHQQDERLAPPEGYVAKMARYGFGHGHLWRVHGLPRALLLYHCARKVVGACVHGVAGRRVLARADLAFLRSAAAGWRAGRARPTGDRVRPPSR